MLHHLKTGKLHHSCWLIPNMWIMTPAGPVTSAPSFPWLSNSCTRDVLFLRVEVTHPSPQAPSRGWGHRAVQAGWAAVSTGTPSSLGSLISAAPAPCTVTGGDNVAQGGRGHGQMAPRGQASSALTHPSCSLRGFICPHTEPCPNSCTHLHRQQPPPG